jgi:ATP-dependent DNA helicase RecQ
VEFSGDQHPVVRLTGDGTAVMRGERPARWLPPPERRSRTSRGDVRGAGANTLGGRGRARPVLPGTSARAHRDSELVLDSAGAALFERLRALRLELAQEHGVPAYVVAHDRTLRELVRLRPDTLQALCQVPGFGPQKLERYGAAFLRLTA